MWLLLTQQINTVSLPPGVEGLYPENIQLFILLYHKFFEAGSFFCSASLVDSMSSAAPRKLNSLQSLPRKKINKLQYLQEVSHLLVASPR